MARRQAKGRADPQSLKSPLLWINLLTGVALLARLHLLAVPMLRWDEGWSLAHASLPWPQLWRIATEEWHPPLYVALLKLWLVTGKTVWGIRFLSVLLGTIAVPLSYAVANAWSRKERVAILAAGFAALWPLLVYYGQVTRMYPLSALPVLAAAWFALRGRADSSWRSDLGLIFSSGIALYTFYYTALALAGIWLYAMVSQPRRIPRLLASVLVAIAAYLPWVVTAGATIQERASSGAAAGGNPLLGTIALLKPTLQGLAFTYDRGWPAAAALAIVLFSGAFLGPWSKPEAKRLALPLLVVGISVIGIAYGAQASRWFAVRHLIPSSPFLGLALAWALDRLAARWRPLLPIALAVLVLAYWPVSTRFVYEKTLEVVDPFDPMADYRYLVEHAGPNDLVYFNVLAKAGWYENLRSEKDPVWSYAMRWDPIIEPMERIAARILADAQTHHRLWFVLYKGTYGPNASLKEWLEANLYPASGEWVGDTLYLAYVAPVGDWVSVVCDNRFENGVRLISARWTPSARMGDACALSLLWGTDYPVDTNYKVFVHLTDSTGQLITQHDALVGTETRPSVSWQVGEEVPDRHGLLLPATSPTPLHIRVGLYDLHSGQRLRLLDGSDAVELGTIAVQ